MGHTAAYIIVALLAGLFLGACTSTGSSGIAKSIPQTIDQACSFYTTTKPQVIAYRDWAKTNWDAKVPNTEIPLIPDEQKKLLIVLDARLRDLDALGVDVCAISDVLKAAAAGSSTAGGLKAGLKNVNWDEVLSTVLKVATTAAQLKAQGAF